MSQNSIIPFLKDYLINFLIRPFLLDTNELVYIMGDMCCFCMEMANILAVTIRLGQFADRDVNVAMIFLLMLSPFDLLCRSFFFFPSLYFHRFWVPLNKE